MLKCIKCVYNAIIFNNKKLLIYFSDYKLITNIIYV